MVWCAMRCVVWCVCEGGVDGVVCNEMCGVVWCGVFVKVVWMVWCAMRCVVWCVCEGGKLLLIFL